MSKPMDSSDNKAPVKPKKTKRSKRSKAFRKKQKALWAGRIKENKERLLTALKTTLGVVTPACELVNISRETFYKYYADDLAFKAAADGMQEIALDFAENSLYKQIQAQNTQATTFYLKTKGKRRGYIERTEIDHTTQGKPIIAPPLKHLSVEEIERLLKEGDDPAGAKE